MVCPVVLESWAHADHASQKPATTTGVAPASPQPAPKLSKAARKAQHVEQNKQLWDSADNPARNHWLETQGVVPLKQEYQVPVTLLSRKPPTIAKKGADGDDDEDSEEERRKKRESEFEERQRKAKVEREEKQKRYAEARERIMGASKPTIASSSRESSQGRDNNRRPRGKLNGNRRSQPQSSAEQSPAPSGTTEQQLFDPEEMAPRPKREPSNTTPKEDQPLRQPRGPDNSGRGGFGFGRRGGMLAS